MIPIHSGTSESGVDVAQNAITMMAIPKIQAFQELARYPDVIEYHGEMKRIMPRKRFPQFIPCALDDAIIFFLISFDMVTFFFWDARHRANAQ
jgi:hypothetical protein